MTEDDDPGARTCRVTVWRREVDVFDDYDDGVISEQLADELASEIVGLGPRTWARFARAAGDGSAPVRAPRTACVPARPRLRVIQGGV